MGSATPLLRVAIGWGTAVLWTGSAQLTIETVRNSTDLGDTDFSEHGETRHDDLDEVFDERASIDTSPSLRRTARAVDAVALAARFPKPLR